MLYEKRMIQALQSVAPNFMYVLSDRNGVEEEAPYVLVSILNAQKIGQPQKTTFSNNNKQIVQQDMRIVYRITLHALATDLAQDEYETMHHGLGSDEYIYRFYQQGLGIQNVGDIIYTSAPVDSVTYKRASIDITCLTNRINEYETPVIFNVETTGELIDKNKDTTNVDIEVSNL